MTKRTELQYTQAFRIIKEKLLCEFPNEIIIDRERVANGAFNAVFEETRIVNCLTHFSATVYKKNFKIQLNI
jgi:hypothetical protein